MVYYYDQCDMKVNGTGIVADSASLDLSNSLEPIISIGKKGVHNVVQNDSIKAAFNLSYYLEIESEPNYGITNLIKNLANDVSWSGITINIAGITGYNCYLNNYSVQIEPNNLLKANASYISFLPVSGQIQNKVSLTGSGYNEKGSFGHSWTTYILTQTGYSQSPVYGFEYSFSAKWEPLFILGRKTPTQVNLMSAEESITIVKDEFKNILYSGENSSGMFRDYGSDSSLDVMNIAMMIYPSQNLNSSLLFNVASGKISKSKLDIKSEDFARVSTSMVKFY